MTKKVGICENSSGFLYVKEEKKIAYFYPVSVRKHQKGKKTTVLRQVKESIQGFFFIK